MTDLPAVEFIAFLAGLGTYWLGRWAAYAGRVLAQWWVRRREHRTHIRVTETETAGKRLTCVGGGIYYRDGIG